MPLLCPHLCCDLPGTWTDEVAGMHTERWEEHCAVSHTRSHIIRSGNNACAAPRCILG